MSHVKTNLPHLPFFRLFSPGYQPTWQPCVLPRCTQCSLIIKTPFQPICLFLAATTDSPDHLLSHYSFVHSHLSTPSPTLPTPSPRCAQFPINQPVPLLLIPNNLPPAHLPSFLCYAHPSLPSYTLPRYSQRQGRREPPHTRQSSPGCGAGQRHTGPGWSAAASEARRSGPGAPAAAGRLGEKNVPRLGSDEKKVGQKNGKGLFLF